MADTERTRSFKKWLVIIDLGKDIKKIDEAQELFPLSRHNSDREDWRKELEKERARLLGDIFEKN